MKTKIIIFILFIIVAAGAMAGFYFYTKEIAPVFTEAEFTEPYRLVSEKISQSAPIKIFLPAQVNVAYAKTHLEITPKIEGSWIDASDKNAALFKPKDKLAAKRFYSIALATPDGGNIQADFEAVEDPKIVAVFPKENSEAPENSEITIVFNRPMVPLTTLGYLEEKNVPVEIAPATEGRFKWITTKNLQFIPKKRLQRSSHYTVQIKPGLTSMDGLEVAGKTIEFTSRKLRYVNATEGIMIYNQPISIYFNQPVDREKTEKYIKVKDQKTGKDVPIITEYRKYVPAPGEKIDNEDSIDANQSVIMVYNKQDRFGRKKIWDFNTSYNLEITRAIPLEGDIALDEKHFTNVNVDDPIDRIGAESERTEYAEQDFIDPQGKAWVTFFEEIDIQKSIIRVPHLKDMYYGEKCKDENLSRGYGITDCEKIQDKKKIYFTFKSAEVGLGEKMDFVFEKIVNSQGLAINKNLITQQFISYPEFKILRSTAQNNPKSASLTEIIICSNSPLYIPTKEERKDFISGKPEYELSYWENSWRVRDTYQIAICRVGEFTTTINYALMPKTDYFFIFYFKDTFAQKFDYTLDFTTGPMPNEHLEFLHMQSSYNVTTPDKTKLVFAEKNMEYVEMQICKLNPKDFLNYFENKPNWYEGFGAVANCQSAEKDIINLPKRYWLNNYFTIDLKNYYESPIGNYILTFTNPNYTRSYWDSAIKGQSERQAFERSYFTVTRLGVAEKKVNLMEKNWDGKTEWEGGRILNNEEIVKISNLYWVTDVMNLEPVSGATVQFYKKIEKSFSPGSSFLTNANGIVAPQAVRDLGAVIVKKGDDSTILPSYESRLNWAQDAFSEYRMYLYTDKPIYRPEQQVAIKGIYRVGYDGNYQIIQDKKVKMKIVNSKGDEVKSEDLPVSAFGTFYTKYIIEPKAPLGSYRACVENYNCAYFDVLEYMPAAFKMEMKTDKEEYISKDTANVDVRADYYFGVPLSGGEVEYTLSTQNYYFDRYSDGEFNFEYDYYYDRPYYYQDRFIKRGKILLSQDGKAKTSEVIDFEKWFKDKEERKSKIIVLDATVKNSFGQSISSQKSFLVHAGEFYLNVNADKYLLGKNEKFTIKTKSVDTQGKPKQVQNIKLDVNKVSWAYAKRQEATGGYSYKWEKQKKLVQTFAFDTNVRGEHSQGLSLGEEGQYEAEVSSQDPRGNFVWEATNFYVYGTGEVSVEPRNETGLSLEAKKTNVNVGEKAEFIIKSPYQKAKALIAIERGEVYEYEIRDIVGNLYPYRFDIKEKYIPNVYVSVLLVAPKPEVRFGQLEFKVNTSNEKINIDVSSDKKYYLPGEKVNLDIIVKDYLGKPVSSELSLSVVDLSVLALKGNPKKNPVIFFYGGFPLTVSTVSNVKNILVEAAIPATKGGGGSAGLSAESPDIASKKRGVFRETAYWTAQVVTDDQGKAKVTFTLPDNLTTWQAETLGVTKDTKLGVNYTEFMTKKKLMAVPLKPRFVVPGDEFYIGTEVFNQSEAKQNINITFESSTLFLKDNKSKQISLDKNESKTVYFNVFAPPQMEDGKHIFIVSAKGQGIEDTVEQTIPIARNDTYEATATADYTAQNSAKEYVYLPDNVIKDKGGLKIQASATLSVFLSDALNYILKYPYGFSEQISSKLNAIAVIKRGLRVPNIGDKFNLKKISYNGIDYTIDELVDIGLSGLYDNQRPDGGFAFWRENSQSSFYVTLGVVEAMNNLKKAGYNINQTILDKAAFYLNDKIVNDLNIYQNRDNIILASYILFSISTPINDFKKNQYYQLKLNQIAQDELYIKEKISNSALAYLDMALGKNASSALEKNISDTLDNRINIDSRGAFLDTNDNFLWYYYETPVKDTALYLKALVAKKSNNPIADKVLRWLLNSRAKDGAWGSTSNTITAIDAFVDYLEWKKENESQFNLQISLDEKDIGSISFGPENILEQFVREVPILEMKFNKNNVVLFSKENKNNLPNNFYYDMSLKYYLPQDQIPPRDEGFSITREYYGLDDIKNTKPKKTAKSGDVLRVHLEITVPETRNFMNIEDYIPAGFEIVNFDLATEQKSLLLQEGGEPSGEKGYYYDSDERNFYPDVKELRDDRTFLYKEFMYPGVYKFDYYVRALIKGKFIHLPAVASEMYFPENFGRTRGGYFEVK